MELNSIKLHGFKSFADSTVIPIRSNLGAIVGPNGCGKSNVVDAIRWVIGSISAKQLRGQSMSDVIFNGTTNRKPVGKAAVELLFDNSLGRLGGEYANYSQIAVRREVERDGQSNYFINGTKCRRRDIIDLFLGTGLGPRSYAIIEQGMISRLIEAKPDEMRAYLEEVAGISKFKDRRRDTENRIARTRANLERVHDILGELETQARRLLRQKRAAERYSELKVDERRLQSQIKALHWLQLKEQAQQHDAMVENKKTEYEEQLSLQRHVETDIERARQSQTEARDHESEVQKRYYLQASEIARLEQQIQNQQEQQSSWQSQLNEAQDLMTELDGSSAEQRETIAELTAELQNLAPQSEEIKQSADQDRQLLIQAEQAMSVCQTQWDEFNVQAAADAKKHGVVTNTLSHLLRQIDSTKERIAELKSQLQSEDLTCLAAELEPLELAVTNAQDDLTAAQSQLSALAEEITAVRNSNKEVKNQLAEVQRNCQSLQSRQASLQAKQQAALSDQSTEEWLDSSGFSEAPRLGQCLKVDAGWETAVEAILAPHFNALCVANADDLLPKLVDFSSGNLTCVEQRSVAHTEGNKARLLLDYIGCDWSLESWLSGVYAVEDLSQAMALREQLDAGESVVTKDGIWLGENWLRIARGDENEDSVLVREQKLLVIDRELNETQAALSHTQSRLDEGEAHLAALESVREEKHSYYQQLSSSFSVVKSDYSAKQSRFTELEQQQQRILVDQDKAEVSLKALLAQQEQAEVEVQSLGEKVSSADERRPVLLAERTQYSENLALAREKSQGSRQRADELEIRVTANENQLRLLQDTIARNEKQLQQVTERRETLESNLSDTGSPLDLLRNELQQRLAQHQTVEQDHQTAAQQLTEKIAELESFEKKRDVLLKRVAACKDDLAELDVQHQNTKVRQDTLIEQLREIDTRLETVLEELPEEANLAGWQEQLATVEKRISRLGPINLAAIEEYEELSERKDYLDKQNADLEESLGMLDEAIQKIDKETKFKFQETFEKVNSGFNALFPKIFGGGRATLELEENDFLTSGVLVKAQPPGKRNSTIHMLSGGEKALTAIALVFAMFQLNPAPFCILDEVDAPLDDVNVGRFCNLVKEMSNSTQFLVISHNKVTIAMADHLMGVTMQEAGVSRIVSVDMEEAIAMAE